MHTGSHRISSVIGFSHLRGASGQRQAGACRWRWTTHDAKTARKLEKQVDGPQTANEQFFSLLAEPLEQEQEQRRWSEGWHQK